MALRIIKRRDRRDRTGEGPDGSDRLEELLRDVDGEMLDDINGLIARGDKEGARRWVNGAASYRDDAAEAGEPEALAWEKAIRLVEGWINRGARAGSALTTKADEDYAETYRILDHLDVAIGDALESDISATANNMLNLMLEAVGIGLGYGDDPARLRQAAESVIDIYGEYADAYSPVDEALRDIDRLQDQLMGSLPTKSRSARGLETRARDRVQGLDVFDVYTSLKRAGVAIGSTGIRNRLDYIAGKIDAAGTCTQAQVDELKGIRDEMGEPEELLDHAIEAMAAYLARKSKSARGLETRAHSITTVDVMLDINDPNAEHRVRRIAEKHNSQGDDGIGNVGLAFYFDGTADARAFKSAVKDAKGVEEVRIHKSARGLVRKAAKRKRGVFADLDAVVAALTAILNAWKDHINEEFYWENSPKPFPTATGHMTSTKYMVSGMEALIGAVKDGQVNHQDLVESLTEGFDPWLETALVRGLKDVEAAVLAADKVVRADAEKVHGSVKASAIDSLVRSLEAFRENWVIGPDSQDGWGLINIDAPDGWMGGWEKAGRTAGPEASALVKAFFHGPLLGFLHALPEGSGIRGDLVAISEDEATTITGNDPGAAADAADAAFARSKAEEEKVYAAHRTEVLNALDTLIGDLLDLNVQRTARGLKTRGHSEQKFWELVGTVIGILEGQADDNKKAMALAAKLDQAQVNNSPSAAIVPLQSLNRIDYLPDDLYGAVSDALDALPQGGRSARGLVRKAGPADAEWSAMVGDIVRLAEKVEQYGTSLKDQAREISADLGPANGVLEDLLATARAWTSKSRTNWTGANDDVRYMVNAVTALRDSLYDVGSDPVYNDASNEGLSAVGSLFRKFSYAFDSLAKGLGEAVLSSLDSLQQGAPDYAELEKLQKEYRELSTALTAAAKQIRRVGNDSVAEAADALLAIDAATMQPAFAAAANDLLSAVSGDRSLERQYPELVAMIREATSGSDLKDLVAQLVTYKSYASKGLVRRSMVKRGRDEEDMEIAAEILWDAAWKITAVFDDETDYPDELLQAQSMLIDAYQTANYGDADWRRMAKAAARILREITDRSSKERKARDALSMVEELNV